MIKQIFITCLNLSLFIHVERIRWEVEFVFVYNDFQFIFRKDLTLNSENNVESVFLEILSCSQFGGRNVIL